MALFFCLYPPSPLGVYINNYFAQKKKLGGPPFIKICFFFSFFPFPKKNGLKTTFWESQQKKGGPPLILDQKINRLKIKKPQIKLFFFFPFFFALTFKPKIGGYFGFKSFSVGFFCKRSKAARTFFFFF